MRKPTVLFLILLFFLAFDFSMVLAKEPVKIRVAVFKDREDVVLGVSGAFDIVDARTRVLLYHGRNLGASRVAAAADGLKIRNLVFYTDAVAVLAKRTAGVSVNNRRYRGEISIIKDGRGKLLVVNILDLEFYIKGVLYHEISHRWPIEAIKAQAVAARTYAVYQKDIMKLKDYDLTADTSSQVYGGYVSEKHRTNRAVNFTAQEVLTYQGRVFPAYFHATCGGTTENAAELWKVGIEPLRGGKACSFCLDSPHYYWKAELDFKTIQKRLQGATKISGGLQNISVAERTGTGRVRTLQLQDESGRAFQVSAKDFRMLLGPGVIRSTNFTILLDKGKVVFNGKGWGHGVGLCQWGALGMSKKGYDYREILAFYYPSSELAKI